MGRDSWSSRDTVEESLALSIFDLKRIGVFEKGPGVYWTSSWTNRWRGTSSNIGYSLEKSASGQLRLRFSYTCTDRFTGEKTPLDYTVYLTVTRCNFGGVRYWFVCPLLRGLNSCGRRVGKLYLPPRARYFGCRQCHDLIYRCQKEHNPSLDALLRNPRLLRERLKRGDVRAAMAVLQRDLRKLMPR